MDRRGLPWLLALVPFALHLAAAGRYDFFRDELYFIACGRHLAAGYVDQPPLIPWIAALSQSAGHNLVLLRSIAALGAAGAVLVTCALVRLLGGKSIAQILAGLAVGLAPVIVGVTATLNTTTFEPLLWTLVAYFAARAVIDEEASWWIGAGVVAGISFETKYTILFFLVALVVSLLAVGPRGTLRTTNFGRGVALALGLASFSISWQIAHGFPFVELLHAGASGKNVVLSPLGYLSSQIVIFTPLAALLWIGGAVGLLVDSNFRRVRFLGLTFVGLFAFFLAMHAKDYYLVGAYPMVFAAGGVTFERLCRRIRWIPLTYATLAAAGALILAPLAAPLLPIDSYVRYQDAVLGTLHMNLPKTEVADTGTIPQTFADQFGWRELARAVERATATLTPAERAHAAVYTQNYGEAGAVDFYGTDVPFAISGHNSYWLWGSHGATTYIIVGGRIDDHRRAFVDVRALETLHTPHAMPSEDVTIFVARAMRAAPEVLWPLVRHYD
jgi:hypothetical protein